MLFDDRPDVDRSLIGVFDHIEELESLDAAARERLRFVMITHYNDGVGAFGPELADPGAGMAGPARDPPGDGAEGHALDADHRLLPGARRHEERGQRRARRLRRDRP